MLNSGPGTELHMQRSSEKYCPKSSNEEYKMEVQLATPLIKVPERKCIHRWHALLNSKARHLL